MEAGKEVTTLSLVLLLLLLFFLDFLLLLLIEVPDAGYPALFVMEFGDIPPGIGPIEFGIAFMCGLKFIGPI